MSKEQFNPEITKKIEENTEMLIQKILAEQKEEINKIDKETIEKIKQLEEKIVKEAKKEADAEFQKEKAKQDLDLRLKITKFRDEIVDEFIHKAIEKIESLIKTKDYEKSLKKIISEAVLTLKQKEVNIFCRKEDKSILSKQFFDAISSDVKKQLDMDVKFNLSDKHITSMGGVVLETRDGKISINNTYEKRIERSLDELKRELSLILIKEEG
jgi:V/A-type H+-transporting ATPase subunit E